MNAIFKNSILWDSFFNFFGLQDNPSASKSYEIKKRTSRESIIKDLHKVNSGYWIAYRNFNRTSKVIN